MDWINRWIVNNDGGDINHDDDDNIDNDNNNDNEDDDDDDVDDNQVNKTILKHYDEYLTRPSKMQKLTLY